MSWGLRYAQLKARKERLTWKENATCGIMSLIKSTSSPCLRSINCLCFLQLWHFWKDFPGLLLWCVRNYPLIRDFVNHRLHVDQKGNNPPIHVVFCCQNRRCSDLNQHGHWVSETVSLGASPRAPTDEESWQSHLDLT
jgi:hypothetical protein